MERPIFILLHQVYGKILSSGVPIDNIEVERGSLLRELNEEDLRHKMALANIFHRPYENNLMFLESCEIRGLCVVCSTFDVENVSSKYAGLLIACDDLEKRYELFTQPNVLHSASSLRAGDDVQVILNEKKTAYGMIRWIGKLYPNKLNIYFGVQLKNCRGPCDGTFESRRYFQAPVDSSVFVPVNQLILKSGNVRIVPIRRETSFDAKPKQMKSIDNYDIGNNYDLKQTKVAKQQNKMAERSENAVLPIKLGERIVWPTDQKNEFGTVKWIGHLPTHKDLIAGVAFDNAVGSGTGNYNGKQLFKAEVDHAALVPVMGLVKADDFSIQNSSAVATAVVASQQTSPVVSTVPAVVSEEACTSDSFQPGSCVELDVDGNVKFGVVRWAGDINGVPSVGVELDERLSTLRNNSSDGTINGVRYFQCEPFRGLFTPASNVRSDSRLQTTAPSSGKDFGSIDSGIIKTYSGPVSVVSGNVCGRPRGIQGHQNSCYLDATLFAMFFGIDAFDCMVLRPKNDSDIDNYVAIQDILKFEIMFPLRKCLYVRADHIYRLRTLLSESLVNVSGLTESEKDPEEVLNGLFGVVFRAQPDIVLTSGETSYLCQLIIGEWGRPSKVSTVQMLLERSFFHSNVALKKIPTRLIVQLPRSGKEKLYKWIVPNLRLDISFILENNPKKCWSCDATASMQCQECFLVEADSLEQTYFCPNCFSKFHASLNTKENDHAFKMVDKVQDGAHGKSKVYLELVSVLCIESSHYVAFSRVGQGPNAEWILFDSMADRNGFGDGYNIPDISLCENMSNWLSDDNYRRLMNKVDQEDESKKFWAPAERGLKRLIHKLENEKHQPDDEPIPPYLHRLLNDCYICFYVWNDGLLYS